MQPTQNPTSGPVHPASLALLNQHLAAAIDLRGQIKHASWNVRGPGATAAYGVLDSASAAVEQYAELIAYQLAELGGSASGTIATAATRSFLATYPLGVADSRDHARAVVRAMSTFALSVQCAGAWAVQSGDAGTAALLYEIVRGLDRQIASIKRLTMAERRAPKVCPFATWGGAAAPAEDRRSHKAGAEAAVPRARVSVAEPPDGMRMEIGA
ncbi:MAG: hypothetical protein HIU82_04600 [Proteobacteria bacterium]|nr:hypothetical protein [Pseudomonadota bacterium]